MSTPASGQRTAANGPTSTPSNPRTRDWTRSGEPGSAFRGLSKARGGGGGERGGDRGGRGGGRSARGGGRGGGGGGPRPGRSPSGDHSNDPAPQPTPAPAKADASSTRKAGPAPAPADVSTPGTPSRPKGPSRRASRAAVPSLVIEASSPTADIAQAGAPVRSANRRRRSQQGHKRGPPSSGTPSSAASKHSYQSLSVDSGSSVLRVPQRARTGPPSPAPPARNIPPHLSASSAAPDVTSFDMKHNIDALVERVRAVANRPTTPGSHIDWAGDDDESLPDLDDWGVTTGTSAADKDEKISPILEDTLKPLPEPISKAEDDAPSSEGPSTSDAQGDLANGAGADAPPSPSKVREEETIEPQDTSSKDSAAPSTGAESTPRTASIPDTNITAVTPQAPKPALHPSLPAKPVVTVGLPPARNGATPMRDPSIPLKPRPAASPEGNAEETSVLVNGAVAKPDIPAKPELDEPGKDGDDADGEQGLHASIHAPKESVPRSSSAPSHITAHPIPTHPRSFSPAHTRSHTVGRPINGLAVPGSALNPHFRSGANSPRAPHHARTHSSPPTGPPVMGHRAPHATRPVITGDAISRLARTIGGSGMRSATVASKD